MGPRVILPPSAALSLTTAQGLPSLPRPGRRPPPTPHEDGPPHPAAWGRMAFFFFFPMVDYQVSSGVFLPSSTAPSTTRCQGSSGPFWPDTAAHAPQGGPCGPHLEGRGFPDFLGGPQKWRYQSTLPIFPNSQHCPKSVQLNSKGWPGMVLCRV